MVSLFEATKAAIPIQVWNEYRSALDHHMRFLTLPDRSNHDQIFKMEGHFQRAVLDICKLFTHRVLDDLELFIISDSVELLRMVNNGRFYESIRRRIDDAKIKFAGVKTSDIALGNTRADDGEIVKQFLGIAFDVYSLSLQYSRARHDIEAEAEKRKQIKDQAISESIASIHEPFIKKMFDHLAGHAAYYGIGALGGAAISHFSR